MKTWITVDRLSLEIRKCEGIWVKVRNKQGEEYNFDQDSLAHIHYSLWTKMASNKTSVVRWKELRLDKVARITLCPLVFFEDGSLAQNHTLLGALRNKGNVRDNTFKDLHFKFDCPNKDVANRLNEMLLKDLYCTKTYIHNGWIFKFNEIHGKISSVRIFPWEYKKWQRTMNELANSLSSKFESSFHSSTDTSQMFDRL